MSEENEVTPTEEPSEDLGAESAEAQGAEEPQAEASPEESAAPAADVVASGMDEEAAAVEEKKIRQELGIGAAKVEVDQQVVEQLLQDAVVGYEEIFSEAPSMPHFDAVDEATANLAHTENLDLLRDVHMKVKVELGRGHMYLKDVLRLGQGSVVELERLAGDPLDIYVNDKVIARGEVLVLNENFCIRITEICDPAELQKQS